MVVVLTVKRANRSLSTARYSGIKIPTKKNTSESSGSRIPIVTQSTV